MKNGAYLIHTLPDKMSYSLNVKLENKIFNYKILKKHNDVIVLIDSINGNREFPSIENLASFYKNYDAKSKGALVTNLTECHPPM